MGDVDTPMVHGGARARRVGGIVMLAVPVTVGLAAWIHGRYPSHVAVLEYLDNAGILWVVAFAFTAGAIALLVPQRVPPPDYRHNRWYIGVGMCLTLLQLVLIVGPVVPRRTLGQTADGDRAVVLYRPDTPHACLRIWQGYGIAARVVGDIGEPGLFSDAYFRDRDTVVLGTRWGDDAHPIRLHPRTGRPLDHTKPCVTPSR